jgi:hypothetical protein
MSIDIIIEIGASTPIAQVRSMLDAAGAKVLAQESNMIHGVFPALDMPFTLYTFDPPKHLQAVDPGVAPFDVASQIWMNPRPSRYDAAKVAFAEMAAALAATTQGPFVISDQFDRILATRGPEGLQVLPSLR